MNKLLITAATPMELAGIIQQFGASEQVVICTTGVGVVETATRLTSFLAKTDDKFFGVMNIGVAGAYIYPDSPQILDFCLASCEVLGDFGICHKDRLELLHKDFVPNQGRFPLENNLTRKAGQILKHHGYSFHQGTFITVQCVSATQARGDILAKTHQGVCENMEGAAVARVCEEFSLPFVELRCISNLVEDRNKQKWKIKRAAERSGEAAALIVEGLLK